MKRKGKRPRLRIGYRTLATIKAALQAAELRNCAVADEHKSAMKLYLDTWVVRRLQTAIREIEGKETPS
jgi:hypothetical protein